MITMEMAIDVRIKVGGHPDKELDLVSISMESAHLLFPSTPSIHSSWLRLRVPHYLRGGFIVLLSLLVRWVTIATLYMYYLYSVGVLRSVLHFGCPFLEIKRGL